MAMAPLEKWDDDFEIPPPRRPTQTYVPDYRPVIKALKELVSAFEVIENRGATQLQEEKTKRRKASAKKRWENVPPEKRRANTAPARAARTKSI
jgi:hypothetical protein